MTIYKFPSDSNKDKEPKKEKQENKKIEASEHKPEFIDIEDLQFEEILEEDEYRETYSSPIGLEKYSFSPLLRLFTFFVAICLFCWFSIVVLFTLFFVILSLGTLGLVPELNRKTLICWKLAKKIFTISLGLAITSFSPALGMAFISLYFALIGNPREGLFERFFKKIY